MPRSKIDPKTEVLRKQGCLHPHPEKVSDEAFASREFFDPRDLVQVKYEMLRRARVEGGTVSQTASGFGLSRPSYYQAQAAFEEGGLPALLPKKPGPRRAHKLSSEVVAVLREILADQPGLSSLDLAGLVEAGPVPGMASCQAWLHGHCLSRWNQEDLCSLPRRRRVDKGDD